MNKKLIIRYRYFVISGQNVPVLDFTSLARKWKSTASARDWRLSTHADPSPRADSSDFRLPGSKVPQNGRFPTQDADEPPCKIWRR